MMFEEREVIEEAADRWWLFLLTGIGWLIVALIVFQWNYTTVYAVSFLFGFVALFAGLNEFFQITVSTSGWKIVHGLLGVLFILAAVWAFVHPHNAFATLAALIAFFILIKGIFDITLAFVTKNEFELWWLQLIVGLLEILLAFWVAGSFRNKVILLVVYVGIIALSRGITEIFLAFKLKGLRRRVAVAAVDAIVVSQVLQVPPHLSKTPRNRHPLLPLHTAPVRAVRSLSSHEPPG
jgi:uncharacterized membrane protein HdeD (DUF308 family)